MQKKKMKKKADWLTKEKKRKIKKKTKTKGLQILISQAL